MNALKVGRGAKRLVWLLFFCCLLSASVLCAGVTVKTTNGKVYENTEIKSVEAGTVVLGHSGGVARIPLAELSKGSRQLLKLTPTLDFAKRDLERLASIQVSAVFQANQ